MSQLTKLGRWIGALPKGTKIVGGVISGAIALTLLATGLVVATRAKDAPLQGVSGAPASCKRAIVLSRAAAGAQLADQGSRQYRAALDAAQNRCKNDPSTPAACKEFVELDSEFWGVVDEGGSPYEWANGAGSKGVAQMTARDACDYRSSRAPLPQAMQSTPYQSGFRCVVKLVAQTYGLQEAYQGCVQAGMSKYGALNSGYSDFAGGAGAAMVCISEHGTNGCPTPPTGGRVTNGESGYPSASTPAPAPTTTEAQVGTGPNVAYPLAQGTRSSGFKTPSENIICWLFEFHDMSERPPRLECALLSAAATYVLPQSNPEAGTQKVRVVNEVKTEREAPVLTYGKVWRFDSIECRSQVKGLTCRDDRTGQGFFLNRENQRVF